MGNFCFLPRMLRLLGRRAVLARPLANHNYLPIVRRRFYQEEEDSGEGEATDQELNENEEDPGEYPVYQSVPGNPLQEFQANEGILVVPDSDDTGYEEELEQNAVRSDRLGQELGIDPYCFPIESYTPEGRGEIMGEKNSSRLVITPDDIKGKARYRNVDETKETFLRMGRDEHFQGDPFREFSEDESSPFYQRPFDMDKRGRPTIPRPNDYFSVFHGRDSDSADSNLEDAPEKRFAQDLAEVEEDNLAMEAEYGADQTDSQQSEDTDSVAEELPEHRRSSFRALRSKAIEALGQETDVSDSDQSFSKFQQMSSPATYHIAEEFREEFDSAPEILSDSDDIIEAKDREYKMLQRKLRNPYHPEKPRDPSLSDLDNLTGDSEEEPPRMSYQEYINAYSTDGTESNPEIDYKATPPAKKQVNQNTFKDIYASKESLFWTEVLQRGRSVARKFELDMDYCYNCRMSGLSLIEWFGFLDKYYSEAPLYTEEFDDPLSMTPLEKQGRRPTQSNDPRFQHPTGRNLTSLFPEMEQAMKNSKLQEHIKSKRDPRIVAASMKKFISNMNGVNTTPANYANRMRMKPTGVQEDYLAKLLSRVADPEMKQVIEKKLHQPKHPLQKNHDSEFAEDLMAEALSEIISKQEYVVAPTFELPEEYRVPNLTAQIDEALETDTDNEFDRNRDSIVLDSDSPSMPDDEGIRPDYTKGCRVCAGYHLEPMNGPLLLQIIDDCGYILPRRQTSFCRKHQRKIRGVVARSVAMGVLEWKEGIVKYNDPFNPQVSPGEFQIPSEIKKGGKYNK